MSELELADDGRDPWERQPGESRQAYANFVIYRDIGPSRSLAKAASETGKNRTTLSDQSAKYRWQDRVDAYDFEMEKRHHEGRMTAIDRMYEEADTVGSALMAAAVTKLRGRRASSNSPEISPLDIDALEPNEIRQFIVDGFRMRLLANRQPTDYVKGALLIHPSELTSIVGEIIDICLPEIPPARQGYVLSQISDVSEGRKRRG